MNTTSVTRRLAAVVTALVMGCAMLVVGSAPAAAAGRAVPVKLTMSRPVAAQTGVGKVTTTVKVVASARSHRASRITITVRLNPNGSASRTGATVAKRVTATWSKGAYRATAKITTKAVGPLSASTTVAGRISRATAKAAAVPSSKLSGWDASTLVDAGKTLTDTVAVTPAYGRKVYLQRWTGTRWATTKTFTTARTKSASVKPAITAGASGATSWRLYAPATTQVRAARTSTRTITARAVTKVTGWTGNQSVDASTSVIRSATIIPAYGRKVAVQKWTGHAWTTTSTIVTSSAATATINVALTAPTTGAATWRLSAAATTKGQAVDSPSFTLTVRTTATPTPSPTSTSSSPTPTPTSTSTPTDEPTWTDPGDPGDWTGPGTGGRDCNAFTAGGSAFACNTAAISNVEGRAYVDTRCGITRTCFRSPIGELEQACYDPVDDWDAFMKSITWYREWFCGRTSWGPTDTYVDAQRTLRDAGEDAPYYTADETLYLPDLINEFNVCRTQGCYDDYGNWWPARGAMPFLPMPGVSSSVTVTETTGATTTLNVPGQGGHAQQWAEHLTDVCHDIGVCWGSWVHGGWDETPVAENGNQGEYGLRGKARAETAVNEPSAVTAPPAGKRWQLVGEIYAQSIPAPHDLVVGWVASSAHRGAVMQKYSVNDVEQQQYVLTGARVDPTGLSYAVAQFYILQDA